MLYAECSILQWWCWTQGIQALIGFLEGCGCLKHPAGFLGDPLELEATQSDLHDPDHGTDSFDFRSRLDTDQILKSFRIRGAKLSHVVDYIKPRLKRIDFKHEDLRGDFPFRRI